MRQIGDYILVREMGKGSLGETYLAEHRFLKTPSILKILPPELASDPEFLKKFEKEVLALSQLEHPHIAKIHNASSADGVYFLVTEPILNADNLSQYFIKKHYKLPEDDILKIARQLASALDFAHDCVCIHGTIKLNNIVVREGEEGVQAYFTDFGLSRIIGPLAALNRTFQSYASSLGLPLHDKYVPGPWDISKASQLQRSFYQNFMFLSPEQKSSSKYSLKSDIYAFGILLYYLLTGEYPEGYFDMPSKKIPELKWNWDLLICRTLQTDPMKRPDHLSERIEELLATREPLPKTFAKPLLKPQEIVRPSFDADPAAVFQIETAVAVYKPEPQAEKEIAPLESEMAVIAAGTYMRGSNNGGRDEMPRHPVRLNAFAIDVHPVTNEQFALFLEAMGGEKDGNNNDIIRLRESRIKRSGGRLIIESGYARHPVVGVTWYGAVAYAKWVGKRLPTEAEWEVAAYGGKEDFTFPTGAHIERSQANFFSSDTTPVMSYQPNGFNLYDMAGNVYEWCQDWYDYHYYDLSVQEPDNPKGPMQGVYRILRGGCWKSSKEDLRCAHRHRNNPGVMNGTYGFRCAADAAVGND